MVVVVRRSYRNVIGAIVSTIGIFAAAFFSVRGASASVVTPEILSQVFEDTARGGRHMKTYAIGCYSQAAYYSQSTYYSQSSYKTTFTSNVSVTGEASILGVLSKGSGTFVIDHPLDPKNKLLYHSFVESPEVKNLYDGLVTLDEDGAAIIELPAYFLALNKDFRYLATPMGEPMPELYLSSEVRKRFLGLYGSPALKIAGGVPNGKVSWQVTGIRHDPYIQSHPIIVEVEKGPGELADKGEYICPECYE